MKIREPTEEWKQGCANVDIVQLRMLLEAAGKCRDDFLRRCPF